MFTSKRDNLNSDTEITSGKLKPKTKYSISIRIVRLKSYNPNFYFKYFSTFLEVNSTL